MLDFTAYDRILNAPWRLKQVGLMWNACLPQYQPRCIPTEEIAELGLPRDKKVFFYSERDRMLYAASFGAVVDYVEQLEPWEEIDAYLFDGTMDWVIAVTHEDAILCLGI